MALTSSLNQTNSTSPASAVTVYCLTAAYAITFIVAVVGNALVISNALLRGRAKTPFDCLIINMATADLIDCIFAIPRWVAYFYVGVQWFAGTFGVFLCKLTFYAMNVSITSSVLTFSVIATDRYLAIVSSTKMPLSHRAVKWSIVGIWMASALIFSTDLYITQVVVTEGKPYCNQNVEILVGHLSKAIIICQFILGYVVPLLVMTVLYSAILRFLYKWQIPGNRSECNSRHEQRYRKRSVKKLVTIVVVFAFCWFPIHVFHFLGIYNYNLFSSIPGVYFWLAGWLAHTNTAINPCLYLYLSRDKRRGNKRKKRTRGQLSNVTRLIPCAPGII